MALDGIGQAFSSNASVTAAIATIGGAIALSAVRSRKKSLGVSMIGIDHTGAVVIPQQAFQWWPESITDTMGTGWQFKQIPGASHALAQWGSNNGRVFAMELKLSRSMRYLEDFKSAGLFGDVPLQAKGINPRSPRNLASNVDIRQMVRYLRAYCYPNYDSINNGIALPPVTVVLNVPGLQLNEDGSDTIWAVMTACDVTYMKAFRDGKPRLATVSLGFQQIVQTANDGVLYKNRRTLMDSLESSPSLADLVNASGNFISVSRDIVDANIDSP